MSGPSLLDSFQRSVRLGGASSLFFRLILSRQVPQAFFSQGKDRKEAKESQNEAIHRLGMEFVAAREEAEAVDGCEIVLGDRPIEVTLKRAWNALSWPSRINLCVELTQGLNAIKNKSINTGTENSVKAMVEALQEDDDFISSMLSLISEKYPEAADAFVHERDLYLAWSLKRSRAVHGKELVVGVVGRGHLRGVCYALTCANDTQLRFKDLTHTRSVRGGGSPDKKGVAQGPLVQFLAETLAFTALLYYYHHYWSTSASPL